jgi:hypothetical protein
VPPELELLPPELEPELPPLDPVLAFEELPEPLDPPGPCELPLLEPLLRLVPELLEAASLELAEPELEDVPPSEAAVLPEHAANASSATEIVSRRFTCASLREALSLTRM